MDNHLLSHAIAIATEAHKGQKDKYGPEWTFEDLKKEGFSAEIIEAVRCVTKTSDEEDYEEYVERCASNPIAVAVKIHDLTDNMDVRRMPCIGEKEVTRLRKYLKAYHRLMPLYMNH